MTKPASGTVPETFTVSLSAASPNTVTVGYSTSNNSAVAGVDDAAASGTATFAPGITSQTVTVNVNGNTTAGSDLSYFLNLASPTNAVIAGTSAYGIIQNPNQNPTLSINTIAVYKAQSGTTAAELTVTLSSASPNTVTTTYSTSNGTGTAGTDYVAKSGTLRNQQQPGQRGRDHLHDHADQDGQDLHARIGARNRHEYEQRHRHQLRPELSQLSWCRPLGPGRGG